MPTNYKLCGSCPYKNQQHLTQIFYVQNVVASPLKTDYGQNSNTLLIFQAPGKDEWQGNTISGKRLPIDSINPHSAAARMRNSMKRKNVNRANFDITEAVQCFPGKQSNGRDKKPNLQSRTCCLQYLVDDLTMKKYTKIVAFGNIAYGMALQAVVMAGNKGVQQPNPTKAPHPSSTVSNNQLDGSY